MIARHRTIWAAPAPLWPEARAAANPAARGAARGAAIGRPAILRFASDEFMDELAVILERDPSQLAYLRAIPETWRNPAPRVEPPAPLGGLNRRLRQEGAALPVAAIPTGNAEIERAQRAREVPAHPCKLYHPAHQRFYLVAACLVCELPGMPDHMLAGDERATFVIRRLRPKQGVTGAPHPVDWSAGWQEYSLVPGGRERSWKLADATILANGEERLPLFPMNYIAEDGRRRRLLAGMLPVARRDAYMAATADETADPPLDPRLALLRNDVVQPYWAAKELLKRAADTIAASAGLPASQRPSPAQTLALSKDATDQAQVITWYALLDLSSYLATWLPYVRQAIGSTASAPFPPEQPAKLPARTLTTAENMLLQKLQSISAGQPGRTLAAALRDIEAYRQKLDDATQTYTTTDPANLPRGDSWPTSFAFLLTDLASLFAQVDDESPTQIETLVQDALATTELVRAPDPPLAVRPPQNAGDPAYVVVRCVHEKPDCGPMYPPRLSAPSLAFELASFFDPEAPARPIRISLPIDSTPGGLRKYTKSVALMLSDQLACQKDRLGSLTLGDLVLSVLPWPFHKDLPADATTCGTGNSSGIGIICSLSIPIITICALLLLMIIVSLLDIIFHWVPFFILCFPLPNFKGKK
jgi:hypothetical protein